MKANQVEFERLSEAEKINQLTSFAQNLVRKPGLYAFEANCAVGQQLLARGIRNVLIGEGASVELLSAQLGWLLGWRGQPTAKEKMALFNVPEALAGKNALLFGRSAAEQTSAAKSQYVEITLAETRAGLTDFGEEMIHFMELNDIESIHVLRELTLPRYQKMGFSGAVYGEKLGIKEDVNNWNTVTVRIQERNCIGCLNCLQVCPAGAIKLRAGKYTPMAEVKKAGWKKGEIHPNLVMIEVAACKGCQLCVEACVAKPKSVEVVKRDV